VLAGSPLSHFAAFDSDGHTTNKYEIQVIIRSILLNENASAYGWQMLKSSAFFAKSAARDFSSETMCWRCRAAMSLAVP